MRTFFFLLSGMLILFPHTLYACAVCFGDPNSGSTKGVNAGVLLLVGIILSLLMIIVSIGIQWRRRAKKMNSVI